jgi:uncharacterized protein (DUF1697 family)
MAASAKSGKQASRASTNAATHVALLRGINVGGKNILAMKDLAALFTKTGCENVQTYIQSGNVVFCANASRASTIGTAISEHIQKKLGLRVPVVIRSRDDMAKVVKGNPFLRNVISPETLHVVFLADEPDGARVNSMDESRSPGDSFIVRGREIFLHLPNGAGRSKLTASYFDSTLKTISTQRNWRTVTTLFDMMR